MEMLKRIEKMSNRRHSNFSVESKECKSNGIQTELRKGGWGGFTSFCSLHSFKTSKTGQQTLKEGLGFS